MYGEVLELLALLSFLWWGLLLVNKWITNRSAALTELRDPVQASFLALVPESILLMAIAVDPYSSVVTTVLFWIGSISNLAYALYRFAHMWMSQRTPDQTTPSLFLTYTASVLVNALVAGLLGYREYGWMIFGVGTISWLILDSVLLQQLMTGGLAERTRNFMGIYMAPGAIVLVAYQVLSDSASQSMITYALAGYSLFLTLSLAISLGWLRKQPFAAGYWAYTFGVATVAQGLLIMAREQHAFIFQTVTAVVLAASLLLTLLVAIASIRLFALRRYYPPAAVPSVPQK